MPINQEHCDKALLRQSLDDVLSDDQEERLTVHLAECETCRRQLESLAAQEDQWHQIGLALQQEASGHISPTLIKGGLSETDRDPDPSDADEQSEASESHSIEFAIDFLKPSDNPDALGRLGSIEIRQFIGRGGNGIVLKGFQPELLRLVAVKVMAPHLATSAAARKRFAREARAAAAVVHPNVMPILHVDSAGQLPFLVMPYVDCESLQDRLDRDGSLPLLDVLQIGLQIARGLAAAHAQGLVHRDVKPANILLERGVERVMLTDFGLARTADDASLTRSGLIAGTPQFMSPEQARGDNVDARSDLFSLGSVMYAMCTGRSPFRAETIYGTLRRVTDRVPRPATELNPEIPLWLNAVIEKLLAKSPEERLATADETAELLEDCVAHVQQPGTNSLPATVLTLTSSAARRGTGGLNKRIPATRFKTGAWLLTVLVLTGLASQSAWNNSGNDAEDDLTGFRAQQVAEGRNREQQQQLSAVPATVAENTVAENTVAGEATPESTAPTDALFAEELSGDELLMELQAISIQMDDLTNQLSNEAADDVDAADPAAEPLLP